MAGSRNRTPAAGVQRAADDELTGTIGLDSTDVELGGLDRTISLAGGSSLEELRDSLNATVSIDVKAPHFKNFADEMKFMNESVLCRVFPSTEPNAEQIIDVYNDGVPQRFLRDGKWQVVKRKYVEVLARSKPFGVATPEYTDAEGNRATKIITNTAVRYPFEVHDKNPRGQAWLSHVLQEA